MSGAIVDEPLPRDWRVLDGVVVLFAMLGLALNLYLLAVHLAQSGPGLTGCGGGGACDELLSSRWSYLLGLPVTAYGSLVYLGVILSFTHGGRSFRIPLLGMIAGAALWFTFVQVVLLGKYCPWCLTAHGVGIVLGSLMGWRHGSKSLSSSIKSLVLWTFACFLSIGLAQLYGPVSAGYRVDDSVLFSPGQKVAELESGRKISFDGGGKTYNVSALPRKGPLDAKWVLVEYFDYQCPACRTLATYLDALLAKHSGDLAVLLLPVPLEGACNHDSRIGIGHPGSCEITRVALAVWRTKPDAFPSYHQALMADPSPETARRLALQIISPERLRSALSDSWIDELIRNNISDWQQLSQSVHQLPKLLIREKRILHGLPTNEADFIRVMEQELGL